MPRARSCLRVTTDSRPPAAAGPTAAATASTLASAANPRACRVTASGRPEPASVPAPAAIAAKPRNPSVEPTARAAISPTCGPISAATAASTAHSSAKLASTCSRPAPRLCSVATSAMRCSTLRAAISITYATIMASVGAARDSRNSDTWSRIRLKPRKNSSGDSQNSVSGISSAMRTSIASRCAIRRPTSATCTSRSSNTHCQSARSTRRPASCMRSNGSRRMNRRSGSSG